MRLVIALLIALNIWLPYSTYSQQIKLFGFSGSTCDTELDPSRLRTRIVSKELIDGIFTIHIAAVATCCVTFIPSHSYKHGTLNLGFQETGEACECGCCYEFTYQISGLKDENVKIKFRDKEIEQSSEKFKTYPVKFEIIDGDTVNYVDRYGLRQGKSIDAGDTTQAKPHFIYLNDTLIKRVMFYSTNKVKSELVREKIDFSSNEKKYSSYCDFNYYIEYFADGSKKRECRNDLKGWSNSYKRGICKEWNDKGELIYQGKYKEWPYPAN